MESEWVCAKWVKRKRWKDERDHVLLLWGFDAAMGIRYLSIAPIARTCRPASWSSPTSEDDLKTASCEYLMRLRRSRSKVWKRPRGEREVEEGRPPHGPPPALANPSPPWGPSGGRKWH